MCHDVGAFPEQSHAFEVEDLILHFELDWSFVF
jgi:hypothetical protein